MRKIIDNLKYIKLKDILGIFLFIIAVPISLIVKLKNKINKKELWLICEAENTARDNGYHLYKYIREYFPNDLCFYAINKGTSDYEKIKEFGNIIQWASLKHWVYYLAADKNISTQKAGNPCAPIFYVLQVYGILKNTRVFLQHGVIKDDLPYIHYKNTKFRLFVCGAKAEYEYVREHFGYPEGYVQYLGLTRFDNLHENKIDNKQILIMPTWRNWLGREKNSFSRKEEFFKTDYYKFWNGFINNENFLKFVEDNKIIVYFYPHIHMHKFLKNFKTSSKNIKIVDNSNIDIQTLLKESALLITDYSSVFMDFAYMNKPIIYYQFDKEKFYDSHYDIGYFNYEKDGFGDVAYNEKTIINHIITYIENNCNIKEEYKNRIKNTFKYLDRNNSERIYKEIKKLDEKHDLNYRFNNVH